MAPANACVYRSSFCIGRKLIPNNDTSTTLNMVPIVTIANTNVTIISPNSEFLAAGYIRIGINGSQGPNTKTVNRIQGVRLAFFGDS